MFWTHHKGKFLKVWSRDQLHQNHLTFLLNMVVPGPYSRYTELNTLEIGLGICNLNKHLKWFLYPLKFENFSCSRILPNSTLTQHFQNLPFLTPWPTQPPSQSYMIWRRSSWPLKQQKALKHYLEDGHVFTNDENRLLQLRIASNCSKIKPKVNSLVLYLS